MVPFMYATRKELKASKISIGWKENFVDQTYKEKETAGCSSPVTANNRGYEDLNSHCMGKSQIKTRHAMRDASHACNSASSKPGNGLHRICSGLYNIVCQNMHQDVR